MSGKLSPSVLLKFSSENCGLCKRMAFHDQAIAAEFELEFKEVYPDSCSEQALTQLFDSFVAVDEIFGWPTYVLASRGEQGELTPLAKYQGGVPKARFREVIAGLVEQTAI